MNSIDFDLNLVRVFNAVYTTRNVSRAAETLNISQPAMSNALRRLRRHCSDPLFVRARGVMEPTPLAHSLAPTLQEALRNIELSLVQSANFDPLTCTDTFRLLTSDVGERIVLPPLLQELSHRAPSVHLEAVQVPHTHYANLLRTNQAALAIGNLSIFDKGFYQRRLFQDTYICIARDNHPSLKPPLTLDTYLELGHVVSRVGSTDDLVESALRRLAKPRRKVKAAVAHYYGCAEIVARTDLIATVPGRAIKGLAGLQLIPLPFEMPIAVVRQFWHQSVHTYPPNKWLRELISNIMMKNDSR